MSEPTGQPDRPALRCPTCRHAPHQEACMNWASDNDCGCGRRDGASEPVPAPAPAAEPTGQPGCVPECNGTWPGPERRPFHVRDCPNAAPTGQQRAVEDVPPWWARLPHGDHDDDGDNPCARCAFEREADYREQVAALHADNERLTAERDAEAASRREMAEAALAARADAAVLRERLAAVEVLHVDKGNGFCVECDCGVPCPTVHAARGTS